MPNPIQCGLNGCTQPVDPDSQIGRCMDCTAAWTAEWQRLKDRDRQRNTERIRRAPVDAVLLMQAWHREDNTAGDAVANNCEIWSVLIQTFGFLFATLRHFGVDIDEQLEVWLAATREQIGEGTEPCHRKGV